MEWKYLVWRATHEAILKALSEAQNTVCELKIAWDNFPRVQLIKLSRVLEIV